MSLFRAAGGGVSQEEVASGKWPVTKWQATVTPFSPLATRHLPTSPREPAFVLTLSTQLTTIVKKKQLYSLTVLASRRVSIEGAAGEA